MYILAGVNSGKQVLWERSIRPNVHSGKCAFGNMYIRDNVLSAKCFSGKCIWKVFFGEMYRNPMLVGFAGPRAV